MPSIAGSHLKFSSRPRLSHDLLILLASFLLASAYNLTFWRSFTAATGGMSMAHLPLLAGCFLLIVFLFNAVLALFSFRFVLKPLLVILFVMTGLTAYFMSHYGVQIDKSMIQNVFETDAREAGELLSVQLVLVMLLLGVLPALAVWRAEVSFPQGLRGLGRRAGVAAGSLALAVLLLVMFFKTLAPTLREHRELRYLLTPTNYIQAINGYLKQRYARKVVVAPLGTDAVKGVVGGDKTRRSVTVIVVGETARAANFSLDGYARLTNPQLALQPELLNFTRVSSCGTATAVSLPCVFSVLGREHYSDTQAYAQEGLLDVLKHADYKVLWRDNNSGCKGACDRVAYEDLSVPEPGNQWCVADECYDERLLDRLPEIIHEARQDMVIVLHQKGSHGPAYFKRYPAKFKRFTPVCETNELEKCSRESIVAAYDNTILYTDHFLNKTIELLKASERSDTVDTAMLYFSDHGESLGEHNLYLHGAPYMISPAEQREVPFMLWLSEGFRGRYGIDQRCLAARTGQDFSHDNVFHSVLGMLNVNTAIYNPRLDIFGPCRHDV
jgi:lipid A ethanolaminephosphotransferase